MNAYEVLEVLDQIIESGDPDKDRAIGLIRHIRDSIELSSALNDDLANARDLFETANFQFASRTFVRTMSAEFEARIFHLQQLLLFANAIVDGGLTLQEQIILRGEAPFIKGDGTAGTAPRYYSFADSIIFTLRLAQRVLGSHIKCDKKDPRWADVRRFISIRNRFMHPKRIEDLDLSDEEGESLNNAQDWLRESLQSIFMHPELLKYIEERRKQT